MALFIDLHTHGLGPWDSRSFSESFLAGFCAAHGEQGTQALLITLYPNTTPALRHQLEIVGTFMQQRPEQGAARLLGVHLEGPFLNPKYAGALDAALLRPPRTGEIAALLDGLESVVRIITVAPELPGVLELVGEATERGIRVQMGHSGATWEEAARGKSAGASGVTHLFNAMPALHHRSPGLVGYALWDNDLYVEAIPDGEHVSDPVVDLIFRTKPLDKILFVSDSVSTPRDGDKAARDGDGRLLGGGPPLGILAERLLKRGIPERAVRATTCDNQLRYLRMEGI